MLGKYVTAEQLEELALIEDDVEVEGVGLFRVRALSFGAMMDAREAGADLYTAYVIHGVMKPELTDEVVRAMPADTVNRLVDAISGLSGADTDFTDDSSSE